MPSHASFESLADALARHVQRARADGCDAVRHLRRRPGLYDYYQRSERIRALAGAGARVLDWGAGFGQMSWFMRAMGLDVTPYTVESGEPSPWNRLLREEFADRVVFGDDPVTLPFESGSFDGVVSSGVLEHVEEFGGDERGSLAEVSRVLRPGGWFFVSMLPNRWSWVEALATLRGRSVHPRKYGALEAERLLARHDLLTVSRRRVNVLPKGLGFLPGFARRLLDRVPRAYHHVDRVLSALPFPGLLAGVHELDAVKTDAQKRFRYAPGQPLEERPVAGRAR